MNMFGPDKRRQPSDDINDASLNSHVDVARRVVIEAVGKSVGKAIAALLPEVGTENIQILYHRTSVNNGLAFLDPILTEGFKTLDKPKPSIELFEIPNSVRTLGLKGVQLESEIRNARNHDTKIGRRFLSGSVGAHVVFFDSILGSGTSEHARKEVESALSLVRPGGYLVYLHDSAILDNPTDRLKFTFRGPERDKFIAEAEKNAQKCLVNAGKHLEKIGNSFDAGQILGATHIPTPILRQRMSAYLQINPVQGDLGAFFACSGLGASPKKSDDGPPGYSSLNYSGHILIAQKKKD